MYCVEELEQQPLIDSDQWGRLQSELGLEMLREFSFEFFEETREIWMVPNFDPFAFEEKAFKSMAHRSAGAAGTIGFKKLRYAFLCLEHNTMNEQTRHALELMNLTFEATQHWVETTTQS
jgi:hypothetical protein